MQPWLSNYEIVNNINVEPLVLKEDDGYIAMAILVMNTGCNFEVLIGVR